ncbi:transcriptional xre family [Trichoderma arundinaceum]|uniref:Transcriptional xre family n=1 Tax=Trichoderma arundinaceum TaxID=490622 RepID=A0A395NJJ0_TRIAR|nr:transcriptional xre family [Trichoderma arundinaceum]
MLVIRNVTILKKAASVSDPTPRSNSEGPLADLWNSIVDEQLKDFIDHDRDRIKGDLNRTTCRKCISELYKKYEDHRDAKLLRAIQPAVEGLQVFETSINSLFRGVPVGSKVWAATQFLLEVSLVPFVPFTFKAEVWFAHIKTSKDFQNAKERGPNVTTLPFGRNLDFYPRDDLLQMSKEHLYPANRKSSDGTQSCVVHRMCGVGKTQLSLECAYRFGCGSPVFWVQAETPISVAEAFGRIAKALNLDIDADNAKWSSLAILARDWLSKNTHWLIVFDNAPDFETIEQYWPEDTHGSVIGTTRNKNLLPPGALSIYVPPMTGDDGAKLLLNYLRPMIGNDAPEYSIEAAKNISGELEGLPLAISHVAGYIRHRNLAAIWAKDFRTSTTQPYGRRFDKAWEESLSNLSDGARSLLGSIALINTENWTKGLPEELPERMLLGETNGDIIT